MTKIALTRIGEVWCSANKPILCSNCGSSCNHFHFIENITETKKVELCKYCKNNGHLTKCTNIDSVYYGNICGYSIIKMTSCPKYVESDDIWSFL